MGHRWGLALAGVLVLSLSPGAAAQVARPSTDWISLFDGESLKGWKETPFSRKGTVAVKDGMIVLGAGRLTGVTYTGWFPHSGYELRFEAARLEGKDFFAAVTFPVKDAYLTWVNGGWGGSVVGLSSLDGDDASENDTSTVRDFETGRWYSFQLKVTDTRVQGWMDGALVVDADLTGRRVGLRVGEIELSTPLGFASYATTGGLRKVEYRLLATGTPQ